LNKTLPSITVLVTSNSIFLPHPTHYALVHYSTRRRGQFLFTEYCVILLLIHTKKSRYLEILTHLEVLDICLHFLSTPSFTSLL